MTAAVIAIASLGLSALLALRSALRGQAKAEVEAAELRAQLKTALQSQKSTADELNRTIQAFRSIIDARDASKSVPGTRAVGGLLGLVEETAGTLGASAGALLNTLEKASGRSPAEGGNGAVQPGKPESPLPH